MLGKLVTVFLFLLIVEGAIRKWVLPEHGTAVFIFKDGILAFAFAAYLVQRQNIPKSPDFAIWIVWVLLVASFALATGFTIQTAVGVRYYLAPMPLILLVPALIHHESVLDRVAAWAVRISIPLGILAVLQYYSPLDSPLNTYAWGNEGGIATFGVEGSDFDITSQRPRVTSTFSYISTYAAFLGVAWILAWLSLLHSRKVLDRWIAGISLVLIFANMGMNGSRALLGLALLTGVPFALALLGQLGWFRSQLLIGALAIGLGVSVIGVAVFQPFSMTFERGDAEEALSRITATLISPIATLSSIEWIGEGIGSTFGGYQQLGYASAKEFDEINLDRVGIELGIIGYVFVLFAKIYMFGKSIVIYKRAPSRHLKHWALVAVLVQLNPPWQIPFYNSTAAILYFCAIGMVYWLEGETQRLRGEFSKGSRPRTSFVAPGFR